MAPPTSRASWRVPGGRGRESAREPKAERPEAHERQRPPGRPSAGVRLWSVRSATTLGGVPEFEVTITDTTRTLDAPVAPTEPTPEIRIQVWRGDATDAEEATDKTWQQWDEAYSGGNRPPSSRIEVTRL